MKKIFQSPYLLVLLSAVLLRLSFPKFDLWVLAWFAFVPLFFAVSGQRLWKVFLFSFSAGLLFYITTIFWLTHVTAVGMVVLSAYLALYVAVFVSGYTMIRPRLTYWQRLLFAPCLWVLLEFTRGMLLTGFPWALLSYSQASYPVALQAADIVGAYGASAIIIFVSVFIFEISGAKQEKDHRRLFKIIVPLLVLAVWFGYGVYRIKEDPKRSCPLKVGLVQGNIPQEIKWVSSFGENIFKKYRLLTEITRLKDSPELIIWPETAYPDYLEFGENDAPLKQFASGLRVPLLVGSIRLHEMHYYNSALLFSSKEGLQGYYDKIHLVPFGEYIPLRKYLPFLARIVPIEDFTAGQNYKIFSVARPGCGPIKFGVLICFEDILSDMAARFTRRGADFLVNMTNDAWFGDTSSPYEHMQASVLRAIENRVYVVRAANTGISCIIDDAGNITRIVRDAKGKEAFVTGYVSGFVYKTARTSLYTRIGDAFAVLCSLLTLGMVFAYGFRTRRTA